jgi:hypothetical protein
MGFFRRKRDDEGFIDLPDGKVAVSDERADELADFAMQRIVESYDEPVAEEAHQAMLGAITERKPDLSGKAGSILLTTARMGYAAREYEESFDSIQSGVPMLTNELRVLLDAGAPVSDAMGGIAGSLCDYSRDDPNAPRSMDAIDGLDGVRDKITRRIAIASVQVAQKTGEFPNGVEAMDIIVASRIGFLVRSCEASLPDGIELTADTSRRRVLVNVTAATDAVEEWWLANPDTSEEEAEAMYRETLESPRFHADLSSEEDPRDADSEYAMFEVDQSGHVIWQPRD